MKLIPTNPPSNPLFSKKQIIEDLKYSSAPLKTICAAYAESPDKWRSIYNRVWKERKLDPEFDDIVVSYMKRTKDKMVFVGGRPRLDKGDKSWQDIYLKKLEEFKGNRAKASEFTPYSWETILQMISPGYTEFDDVFAKRVRSVELKLSAYAEETMYEMLMPEYHGDMESSKIAQTRAWIADRILQKVDRERWGNKVDMKVEGKVRHEFHDRQVRINLLVEEQKRFLSDGSQNDNVIDVTSVPVKEPVECQSKRQSSGAQTISPDTKD